VKTMIDLPEQIRTLKVTAFGEHAGVLTHEGHYGFVYTDKNAVSLTMKYRAAPFNSGALHPVFAQNLPEGYVRRYISERLRRYAQVNDMYLLALQFDKGVGHLGYHSDIEKPNGNQLSLSEVLSWKGSESLFQELLEWFYLNGLVSGVQPKVLIHANMDIPDKAPSGRGLYTQNEFIVKTFDEEFPLLTVNEYVCMEAARACGLEPANCYLSDDLKIFITERFDIAGDAEGKNAGKSAGNNKLAVEDFTVLMGKSSDEKYSSSYESLMKAVGAYTGTYADLERAYRYIAFNCLIGNGDAHLKNFAVQYERSKDSITLTPPYDITHTLIYPTIDDKMALKLAKARTFPDKHELVKLGNAFEIRQPEKIVESFADRILDSVRDSSVISEFKGLADSIGRSVSQGATSQTQRPAYRYDRRKKYT